MIFTLYLHAAVAAAGSSVQLLAWLDASFSSCRDYRKRNWENQPVKFEWWLTPSCDSHYRYQRLPWRKHFADLYCRHAGTLQDSSSAAGNHSHSRRYLSLLAGLSPEGALLDHHKKYRHENKNVNGGGDHAADDRRGNGFHYV